MRYKLYVDQTRAHLLRIWIEIQMVLEKVRWLEQVPAECVTPGEVVSCEVPLGDGGVYLKHD